MAIHRMIDLETLDFKPSSTILTVGGVEFNPYDFSEPYNEFYIKVNIDEQDALGRTVSDSTLKWWSEQDPAIQEEAFSEEGRVSVAEALKAITKFVMNADTIWVHGCGFDSVILEDIYRQTGTPVPWNFWQIRDSRTLFSLIDSDPRKGMQQSLHNALADAYYQAKGVQIAYGKLGLSK